MSDALRRIDFCFALDVVSALHIGSGEAIEATDKERLAQRPGDDARLLINRIQRDHEGKPWIPGSALKGALRAAAGLRPSDLDERLFGEIKEGGGGRMGALLARGASMMRPGDTEGLPFPQDGVFISARTAIEAGRGVSDANKLFHEEVVAPGARFEARLRLEARGETEALERRLMEILGLFATPEGRSIGADAADGLGRARIPESVERIAWKVHPETGALIKGQKTPVSLKGAAAPSSAREVALVCDWPFLTRDPAYEREEKEGQPHIRPLRHKKQPYLTGAMISGALRARASWLAALDKHRGKPPEIDPDLLFGTEKRRGALSVIVMKALRAPESVQLTSVRIDRFSGGTIDNALFSTETDRNVSVTLRLSLEGAHVTEANRKACGPMLERLLGDLQKNGLRLGHGTGRGFGWFRVEKKNG